MRIAVYGGSFDPPHVGHLMVASWLRWTDQADEVWLVPSFGHPFGKDSAPFATRLAWCRKAVEALPGVEVSAIEASLPRPSYTLHTLDALAEAHPEHAFRFVLGTDALAEVDRWHRWTDIAARYPPIVVSRGGYPAGFAGGETPTGPVFPEVSSTAVRDRARLGEPIDAWVPRCVLEPILQHYAPPGAADAATSD